MTAHPAAHLTQRQAAQQWAIPWTTFRRAVKAGKVSIDAEKRVNVAEMIRAFGEPPAQTARAETGTSGPSGTSAAQPLAHPDLARLRELETEVAWQRQIIDQLKARAEFAEQAVKMITHQEGRSRPSWWKRTFG